MSIQWTSAANQAQGIKPAVIRMGIVIGMLMVGLFGALSSLHAQSPLTIQSSTGNVGIGTTNPSQQLHITGNFLAGGGLVMFPGTGSYPRIGKAGDDLTFSTNASLEMVRFTNTGNVGIGTTGPGSKLEVRDDSISNPAIKITSQLSGANTKPTLHLTGITTGNQGTNAFVRLLSGIDAGGVATENDSGLQFEVQDNGVANLAMTINQSGNVGIGTTAPTSRLHVIGDITATGAKNFQIDHPLEPEKKLLVHSALEGPEVAVYYRGEAQLVNGEVVITLPAYFESLTRKEQRTVQLTPIKGWSPLYVSDEIQDGKFTVRSAAGGNLTQRFYWEVKAVRADVPSLVVEKMKEAENMRLAESTK